MAQSSQGVGRIERCLKVPSYCRERAGRDLDLSTSCLYRLHQPRHYKCCHHPHSHQKGCAVVRRHKIVIVSVITTLTIFTCYCWCWCCCWWCCCYYYCCSCCRGWDLGERAGWDLGLTDSWLHRLHQPRHYHCCHHPHSHSKVRVMCIYQCMSKPAASYHHQHHHDHHHHNHHCTP